MAGIFSRQQNRAQRGGGAIFLLLATLALSACRDAADDFFSGRPSAMAMAHNGALDGSVAAMRTILEIPARLPQARLEHQAHWQESPIAWWLAPGGRERILAALAQLDAAQLAALQRWLVAPEPYGENKQRAIAELRLAVATAGARP